MAASCCTCMAWGIVPSRASVVVFVPRARVVFPGPCTSRFRGVVVQGGDLLCEANSSEMQRTLRSQLAED
jgi:hypothetical protein